MDALCIEKEKVAVLGKKISELLVEQGLTLATAESCTGGRIAACVTAQAGCSSYYQGGIVAYSNEVKIQMLGVSAETLALHGAVSEETVCEMAFGAMQRLKTDCAVATSGIAGPGGGTPEKPVGTIWIAAAFRNRILTRKLSGDKGRCQNMMRAAREAFQLLGEAIKGEG